MSEPVLVRVGAEILEHLKTGDVEPVVILGVREAGDGTYDMTLKVPDLAAANLRLAQALRLIRDTTDGFASRHAAATLDRLGIEDPEEDCDVF
jgi:hypothetical protein